MDFLIDIREGLPKKWIRAKPGFSGHEFLPILRPFTIHFFFDLPNICLTSFLSPQNLLIDLQLKGVGTLRNEICSF